MKDEYATLRAAFHAGATIQAYTIYPEYADSPYYAKGGEMPINILPLGSGYWRDLSCDGEPRFICHPSRYRVKPEDMQRLQADADAMRVEAAFAYRRAVLGAAELFGVETAGLDPEQILGAILAEHAVRVRPMGQEGGSDA